MGTTLLCSTILKRLQYHNKQQQQQQGRNCAVLTHLVGFVQHINVQHISAMLTLTMPPIPLPLQTALQTADKQTIVGSLKDMLYKRRMERELLRAKGECYFAHWWVLSVLAGFLEGRGD